MKNENSPYGNEFFKDRSQSSDSAKTILPFVIDLLKPESVIDVGCGTGEWLEVAKELNVHDILGVDGDWIDRIKLKIPATSFQSKNLDEKIKIERRFDLAISLEVGEHLKSESAADFVGSLTNLSSVVLFSAAIPNQGGVNHINEQWQEYWAALFLEKGFVAIDYLRPKIWNNNSVKFYYRQNILIYVEKSFLEQNAILKEEWNKTKDNILNIVHPILFEKKNKRIESIFQFIPAPVEKVVTIIKKSIFG